MIQSASLTDPTIAYAPFASYPTVTLPTTVSLSESHVPNGISPVSSATVAALTAAAAASAGIPPNVKDSRWLTLEVCRQYQRNQCSRDESECKFAHPPTHVDVQNGRVVCCYDSIKGKCQRRDPPCKYLHPPLHLREQLMQNGRNNMILRNMQLQLLQHHWIAQSGMVPFNASTAAAAAAAAVAAAANNSSTGSNPSGIPGTNATNSLIYPGPAQISLGTSTISSTYPFLSMGFPAYMGSLTNGVSGMAHHVPIAGSEMLTADLHTRTSKRNSLSDGKNGHPVYLSRSNGAHGNGISNGKIDDTSGACVMVVNGGTVDSLKDMNGTNHSAPMNLRCANGNGLAAATATATLYALQHTPNSTLLNLSPHRPHHSIASLTAASLAAVVNGNVSGTTIDPSHFTTIPEHAGYFQPTYHIEIPPQYSYH